MNILLKYKTFPLAEALAQVTKVRQICMSIEDPGLLTDKSFKNKNGTDIELF
jgi:hypothetical protein